MSMETSLVENGYFGEFGGSYVPDGLKKVLNLLNENFNRCKEEQDFVEELQYYLKEFVGRENPLTYAEN